MILLATIFYFIGKKIFFEKAEPMVAYHEEHIDDPEVEKEKVVKKVQKTPTAPSAAVSPVIQAQAVSAFSVSTIDVPTETLSTEFGESEGFGAGWGSGFDGAGAFGRGGGGMSTLCGRTGGMGLKGHFYDFKQDQEKRPTALGKFYAGNNGGSRVAVH